jgi:hypothetical protein
VCTKLEHAFERVKHLDEQVVDGVSAYGNVAGQDTPFEQVFELGPARG